MEAIPEFAYQIEKFPEPEHVGTITVYTKFVRPDYEDLNFSISLPINEFTNVEDSPHKERLYNFLKDLAVDPRDALKLIQVLTLLACKVTSSFEYRSHYALLIRLTLTLHVTPSSNDDSQVDESFIDDSQLEEVIQASLDEDDERRNSEFRPARKLRVGALSRRIYKRKEQTSIIADKCTRYKRKPKTLSSDDDMCTICFMEFRNGRKVATLLCGHEFHNTCIMKWIKVGHNCPLCRLELTREDD